MPLSDFVDVSITRNTRSITRAGFSKIMVLDAHTNFADDWKDYSDLDEMVADGFLTTDPAYLAAQAIVTQEPRPAQFRVGKASTPVAQVITYTPTVQNSANYTVTINGTLYDPANSDADATATEIVTLLKNTINADTRRAVDATGTTTLIITARDAGAGFLYSATSNLTAAITTANNGPMEDITAFRAQPDGDNWYGLILADRVDWVSYWVSRGIEAIGTKLFACVSTSTDTVDATYSSSTPLDLASRVKALGFDYTAVFYDDDGAQYLDASLMSEELAKEPGSSTWKFKTPKGVLPITLTTTQRNNLKAKSVNWLEETAGVNITAEGTVASGEFIDVIFGCHALQQRMAEDVFEAQVENDKIPFTKNGLGMIGAAMRPSLERAERAGFLAADPKYTITLPDLALISSGDKAARILNDVHYSAVLAGAIHKVGIAGNVSA